MVVVIFTSVAPPHSRLPSLQERDIGTYNVHSAKNCDMILHTITHISNIRSNIKNLGELLNGGEPIIQGHICQPMTNFALQLQYSKLITVRYNYGTATVQQAPA